MHSNCNRSAFGVYLGHHWLVLEKWYEHIWYTVVTWYEVSLQYWHLRRTNLGWLYETKEQMQVTRRRRQWLGRGELTHWRMRWVGGQHPTRHAHGHLDKRDETQDGCEIKRSNTTRTKPQLDLRTRCVDPQNRPQHNPPSPSDFSTGCQRHFWLCFQSPRPPLQRFETPRIWKCLRETQVALLECTCECCVCGLKTCNTNPQWKSTHSSGIALIIRD